MIDLARKSFFDAAQKSLTNASFRIFFFTEILHNIIVIMILQRFQTIYGISPLKTDIWLISFNFLIAFETVFVNRLAVKTKIKSIYLFMIELAFQLIDIAFHIIIFDDIMTISASIYGFEVIAKLDINMMIDISFVIPPHVVEMRDLDMRIIIEQ